MRPAIASVVVPFVLLLAAAHAFAAERSGPTATMVAGMPEAEALRTGERMYREGILPSGKPLQAIVKGDIPVVHGQFTCAHCHQRSGFGSMEGTIRTWPITGSQLYTPLSKFKRIPSRGRAPAGEEEILRPAYTDASLARVLMTGIDPSGRQLNDLMPIYGLGDRDMAILVHYLRNLSTRPEPGVTGEMIRFATIIAGDVPKARQEAMLVPLRSFLANWRVSRNLQRMTRADAYLRDGTAMAERRFSLTVWELTGAPETWRDQLEEKYRKDPVFAVLGGVTATVWEPVHRFCEDNRIPALFPETALPAADADNGYTLYLSRGYALEAAVAASYLHGRTDLPKNIPVLQVFRPDAVGRTMSRAFEDAWTGLGHGAPLNREVRGQGLPGPEFWKHLTPENSAVVLVLWLEAGDLPEMGASSANRRSAMILASATLMGDKVLSLAEEDRGKVYLTYPYRLPGERGAERSVNAAVQSLIPVLRGPLLQLGLRSFISREYFLELLESNPDLAGEELPFPRLSFGAGQRYASKGCYIVQLSPGPSPELVKRTDWLIP